MTSWPGGVYATSTAAGSRPGAVIAGAWASMQFMGIDGYTKTCQEIVGAAKKLELGIKETFKEELYILGQPKVSVIAFGSKHLKIYEIGDIMSTLGWHLNALQNPPALHIACTLLTVPVIDTFLKDLRIAVDKVKSNGGEVGGGSMVMIYGLGSSSAVGPGLVEEMSSRYMDVVSFFRFSFFLCDFFWKLILNSLVTSSFILKLALLGSFSLFFFFAVEV